MGMFDQFIAAHQNLHQAMGLLPRGGLQQGGNNGTGQWANPYNSGGANGPTSYDEMKAAKSTTIHAGVGMAKGGSVEPEDAVWKPEPGFPAIPPPDDDPNDNKPHAPAPREQEARNDDADDTQNLATGGSVKSYDDGGDVEDQEDPGDAEADLPPDEQADLRRRADEERITQDTGGEPAPKATPAPQGAIPDDATGSTSEDEPATGEHADPEKQDWVQNSAAALRSGYDYLKKQFGLDDAVPGPDYAKGVASYHGGAGAAPHADTEAAEAASDPQRQLTDQERTTKALSDVHDFYGDQSGEKVGSMLQRLRHLYTTYAAHAVTALENGDIGGFVKSFNEANSNIPGPTRVELREAMRNPVTGGVGADAIRARFPRPAQQTPEGADEQEAAALGEKVSKPKQEAPAIPDDRSGDEDTESPAAGRTKTLSTPEGGYAVPDRAQPPAAPAPSGQAQAAPLVMVQTDTATGKKTETPTTPEQAVQHLKKGFDDQVQNGPAPGQMVQVSVNGRTKMVPHEPAGDNRIGVPPGWTGQRIGPVGDPRGGTLFRSPMDPQRPGSPTRQDPTDPRVRQHAMDVGEYQRWRGGMQTKTEAAQRNKVDVATARRGDPTKTIELQQKGINERHATDAAAKGARDALLDKRHTADQDRKFQMDRLVEARRSAASADPFNNNPTARKQAFDESMRQSGGFTGGGQDKQQPQQTPQKPRTGTLNGRAVIDRGGGPVYLDTGEPVK